MLESIPYSVVAIAAIALSATCVLAALLHRFGRIVPKRGAAPLLVLAIAAVLYGGTKPGSGTNAPPLLSGVFAPRSASVAAFTDEQLAAGFALAEVRTNETHDFAPPPGAVVHEPWRRRGAHEDFISLPATNWSFPWGTATVSRATVLSSGDIGFDGGYSASNRIAPFAASLGIVPEANWPLLGGGATNSLFWHAATSDSLTLTWLNALLDRDTNYPVSFQASLHRSGDFVFRYDLPAALALSNFQLSQSSQLSQPASSPFAGAFANGFGEAYTNGPATTLRWASLAGLANDADLDGDGLSDADEVLLHFTNPRLADSDLDGSSDWQEVHHGTDPFDPDEDGDGVPDGVAPADWYGNALWAGQDRDPNFVVTLAADIPDGEIAILSIGDLSLPLGQARSFALYFPAGQLLPFRLASSGGHPIALSIEDGTAIDPPWSGDLYAPAPIWIDDRSGVFDGRAGSGAGFLARPAILLDDGGRGANGNECIHDAESPAMRSWTVSILPAGTGLSAADMDIVGFQRTGEATVSLSVGSTPGESVFGGVILASPALRFGAVSEWREIHRCTGVRGWPSSYLCHVCGFPHDMSNSCSHDWNCAAVLDPDSSCTCSNIFVHVAWGDADGNGIADKDEPRLVPGTDIFPFHAVGTDSGECCCAWRYSGDYARVARLGFHSSNLRIFGDDGGILSPGSTSTVFEIQAIAASGSVGGSRFAYELLDHTNGVLRTVNVPVTAWDISDTGLAFNWATNSHSADAINLRRDHGTPIVHTHGEWLKPPDHASQPGRNEPACWIAGTLPEIRARFMIAPFDIASAVISAESDGTMLGDIPATEVAFSNGVTRATDGASHPDYAAFPLAMPIPAVVSRSTNEMWRWTVRNLNGHTIPPVMVATNGPCVAYSILGAPVAPWTDNCISNQNVWSSVLDFIITNACEGATTASNTLAELTQFLFSEHGLMYDTTRGRSSYFHFTTMDDASYNLGSYMAKTKGAIVNCYDQAGSLAILSRSLGIDAELVYMSPFGYINQTVLVGGITSNNPFHTNPKYDSRPVCPTNEPLRSGFGNHMFVTHDGNVFDSCAGPVTGQFTCQEYISSTIDTNTVNTLYPTGTITNANHFPRITEILE